MTTVTLQVAKRDGMHTFEIGQVTSQIDAATLDAIADAFFALWSAKGACYDEAARYYVHLSDDQESLIVPDPAIRALARAMLAAGYVEFYDWANARRRSKAA